MLALDGRWLPDACHPLPGTVAGLIGISGPYDFLPIRSPTLIEIFGGASRRETQPIEHVRAHPPPALLITGKADRMVDPGNTVRLAKRLREQGGSVRLVEYPLLGHVLAVAAIAVPWPLRLLAPVLGEIDAFVRETVAVARHATTAPATS